VFDSVGVNLIELVLTEFLIFWLSNLTMLLLRYLVIKVAIGNSVWQQPSDEVTVDYIIRMLYSKAVQWLVLLMVPYFVLLMPLIDYCNFLSFYWILKHFHRSGGAASKDLQNYMMPLLNVT
jgi:hypothetical protein